MGLALTTLELEELEVELEEVLTGCGLRGHFPPTEERPEPPEETEALRWDLLKGTGMSVLAEVPLGGGE